MDKRRRILILIGILVVVVAVAAVIFLTRSCGVGQGARQNSPNGLAQMARDALERSQFADFQKLFTPAMQDKIGQQTFAEIGKDITNEAIYSNCVVMRLNNGQMYLLFVSAPDKSGLYYIEDIKKVPADMVQFFTH